MYRVTYIGFCFNYMYMYNDSIVKLVHVSKSYILITVKKTNKIYKLKHW